MNKKRWWRYSLFAVVILTCLLSFIILRLDAQSEQGLLNTLASKQEVNESPIETPKNEEPTKSETKPAKNEEHQSTLQVAKEEPISDSKLDFLVVIDPGHQQKANLEQEPIGPGATETKYKVTGGTTGVVTNKPEYVLNLEASLLLQKQLEDRGIQVILTRTTHDVDISNKERAEIANNNDADLFIRIHADGSESAATKGFSVLMPSQDNPYTSSIYQDSHEAATYLIEHVSSTISLNQGGIFYRSDMSGFNWSKVPVILPEIGFMTNPEDDQNLSNPTYLANLMELMAVGIEKYAQSKQ